MEAFAMKIIRTFMFIVIPITIFSIIALNIAFKDFFNEHIFEHEQLAIESAKQSLMIYLNEKQNKYNSSVNDWAHWDDTYDFIKYHNTGYLKQNYDENTFETLDLSFVMITEENNILYDQFFNQPTKSFAEFPEGLKADLNRSVDFSKIVEDTNGILQLGDRFYFIAVSPITDSEMTEDAAGNLIFGKLIDNTVYQDIERFTGCSIKSISVIKSKSGNQGLIDSVVIKDTHLNDKKDALYIDLLIPSNVDDAALIQMTLSMSRALFIEGLAELNAFILISTIVIALMLILVFVILGFVFNRPIKALIKDIQTIDIKDRFVSIPENGYYEIRTVRKTLNDLIRKIQNDHKELKENKEKLEATLRSVGDGVITTDEQGNITFINPVAEILTGWKFKDARGLYIEQVFIVANEKSKELVDSPIREAIKTKKIVELGNHTVLITKDNKEIAIEDTAAPIMGIEGQCAGCVLVFRDVTERKEKVQRIEYLNYHDQNTGLYNQRYFDEEVKRLDVKRNLPISFIYSDVNGLKLINDAFGHESGDKVIKMIANVYKKTCREDDIIARVGGDEFVILLPHTDNIAVKSIVGRIKDQTEKLVYKDIAISVAFGWDTKTDTCQSFSEVMRNAEKSMYNKKIIYNSSKRSDIIKSIMHTLMVKSPREEAHSIRVSELCVKIGEAFNLNVDKIRTLEVAAELHDIGKIAIDDIILNKKGLLNNSQWIQMKQHPETGFRILGAVSEFTHIARYVLQHHERWDGKGYPSGIKEDEISWEARVIAIADAYDAMTTNRPYKESSLSIDEAIEELKKNAGHQFDPHIVEVFINQVLHKED
jgi:diguanylate cyclase (GGDEF)-like protein/PAS domain S-box-containing protein